MGVRVIIKPASTPDLIIVRWSPSPGYYGSIGILRLGDGGEPTIQTTQAVQPDTARFLADLADLLVKQEGDDDEF